MDVGVSLGSGQFNLPVTAVLKRDDGKANLLKAEDDDTLRNYAPVGAKLFSDRSSCRAKLPKRAINLLVNGLNDDDKGDLVLPFGAQAARGQTNQITIFLLQ